jgi:hypothetical protein
MNMNINRNLKSVVFPLLKNIVHTLIYYYECTVIFLIFQVSYQL